MFKCNVSNMRESRQNQNIKLCLEGRFQDRGTYNPKALSRFCKSVNVTVEDILKDERLHQSAALYCAKLATRQGNKDEDFILDGIDKQFKNIHIENLSSTELRPMNDGRILTHHQMLREGLTKEDGLKSFDFTISGNLEGYGTAKVVVDGGGHQDTVQREMMDFIQWVNKYGKDKLKYVCLIDGNEPDDSLYSLIEGNNIWVVNHIEFQKRLAEYE